MIETKSKLGFDVGDKVTWAEGAPATWRWIYTPGPMTVVSWRWQLGGPTPYSARFGLEFPPGKIYTVLYEADSTSYYDPPLSLITGRSHLTKELHEMWLARFAGEA